MPSHTSGISIWQYRGSFIGQHHPFIQAHLTDHGPYSSTIPPLSFCRVRSPYRFPLNQYLRDGLRDPITDGARQFHRDALLLILKPVADSNIRLE